MRGRVRLAPGDVSAARRPAKGEGPGPWQYAPIDRLLGIRTGGNLAVIPNRVIFLAGVSETQHLAATTWIHAGSAAAAVSEVVTWGRIDSKGRLLNDDPRGRGSEPIIAVTSSFEWLSEACRASKSAEKLVIADGTASVVRNLQSFDDTTATQRLIIIADENARSDAMALHERGCDVWEPGPEAFLVGTTVTGSGAPGWFSTALRRARNGRRSTLELSRARDDALEEAALRLVEAETAVGAGASQEPFQGLLRSCYRLLLATAEWVGEPGDDLRAKTSRQVEDVEQAIARESMWLGAEFRQGLSGALACLRRFAGSSEAGASKLAALFESLPVDPTASGVSVLVRTAPWAARLRDSLGDRGIAVEVTDLAAANLFERRQLILTCWPNRARAARLVNQHLSPGLTILAYPFEEDWVRAFSAWSSRETARFRVSPPALKPIAGVWDDIRAITDVRCSEPDRPEIPEPLTRYLSIHRKGLAAQHAPESELREARYVSFHGQGYAILTEEHKVPVLTELIQQRDRAGARVPLRPVRKLRVGDYVLFRAQGDRDVIAAIAAAEMGAVKYAALRGLAGRWRTALLQLGNSAWTVHRRLRESGVERSLVAVRFWMTDEAMIGPGSRADLEAIARLSGNELLLGSLDEVEAALKALRAAHVHAGLTLSRLLLAELPGKIPELDESGATVDFGFGNGFIVCVEEIAADVEDRPYWEVNHLLFDYDA